MYGCISIKNGTKWEGEFAVDCFEKRENANNKNDAEACRDNIYTHSAMPWIAVVSYDACSRKNAENTFIPAHQPAWYENIPAVSCRIPF